MGIFFLSPGEYLAAILVGSAAALLIGSRQRPMKLAFNLANFLLVAVVSLTILYTFADMTGPPHIRDWIAAFVATEVSTIIAATMIATVITVSGGAPQFEKLPEMIRFGALVAFANTSLALLAVSILWLDPSLLWLLALPLVVVFLAYQAYGSEREKHERLELLYQSVADPPALARAGFRARGPARPRPGDVPGRARRGRALSAPRGGRGAADPLLARGRARGHHPGGRARRAIRSTPACARRSARSSTSPDPAAGSDIRQGDGQPAARRERADRFAC